MLHRRFAFAGLVVLALAACGGTHTGTIPTVPTKAPSGSPSTKPTTAPSASAAPGSATVSFLVVVPAPAVTTVRRPHVVVPSGATSVTFTLDSVNGTASGGTPTTETLSSSNSSCQSVSGQLSCAFNLTAPVGALIYTITVYDGSTVLAAGNVAMTTTNGSTVSAPLTTTGTVAKVAITVGAGVAGIAATVPITVQAENANGYTILGTYTNPIALTDSDTSGATSITTTGSDNPPADELLSSSDAATLKYTGAALNSAATIGATASGVASSNIATATFSPINPGYLAQSGSLTFGVTTEAEAQAQNTQPPSPSPSPSSTTYPVALATSQAFNGVSDLVGVTGATTSSVNNFLGISSAATAYYDWSAQDNGASLGYIGYTDPNNTMYLDADVIYYQGASIAEESLQQTCAAPYPTVLTVPLPSPGTSSNVYAGTGTCTTAYSDTGDLTDTYAYSASGAYTDAENVPNIAYGLGIPVTAPGSSRATVDAAGDLTYTITWSEEGLATGLFAGTLNIPAPAANASTVTVNASQPNPTASPVFSPEPGATTAPNPWAAIGLSNGTPPNPLFSDSMTNRGSISALPSQCAIGSGILPSNPQIDEVDESVVVGDPLGDWGPFYASETIKHYYVTGVGEVCNENQTLTDWFDAADTGYFYNSNSFVTFNGFAGGAIAYYEGVDPNWDSDYSDTYTYLTAETLNQIAKRVRDFTQVMPAATAALTIASRAMAHARMTQPPTRHRHVTTKTPAFWQSLLVRR